MKTLKELGTITLAFAKACVLFILFMLVMMIGSGIGIIVYSYLN